MILLSLDPDRPRPPEGGGGSQDSPLDPAEGDRAEGQAPEGIEQAPEPAAAPPELPSYPRSPGPRAAARQQRRSTVDEDEHGLPTYPRESRPGPRRTLLDRLIILVVVLAGIILIAYAVTRADRTPPADSALAQALGARIEVSVETTSPERARQFIRDEFGWSVGTPVFGEAQLRGVGIGTLAPAVEVPVFLYADEHAREAAVFALSYALLDQVPDRVRLSRADYDRLAQDPDPRTHRVGGRDVALWRDRADIYILVSDIRLSTLIRDLRVVR